MKDVNCCQFFTNSSTHQIVKNDDLLDIASTTASGEVEEEVDVTLAPPVMTVTVSSSSMLQLTLTKTCLEMLTNLGKVLSLGEL